MRKILEPNKEVRNFPEKNYFVMMKILDELFSIKTNRNDTIPKSWFESEPNFD